ncbi:MAG TPA: NUDIX hydrolase [Candidatus Saccharimonas sp.]|nr:NUDIX hydrolase [Candidatus Saccharimonas sp.]
MLGALRRRINYLHDVKANNDTREYVTRKGDVDLGAASRASRLDDVTYGRGLDRFIPVCADIAVIRHTSAGPQILVGVRQQEPHPSDWVIGGSMIAGESWVAAATRNVQRELGFTVDPLRLSRKPVGFYSLQWDTRAQEPVQNGCHMLSALFVYRYGDEPIKPNEEYEQLYWTPVATIANSPIDVYHPAFRQMAYDVLQTFI